MLVIASSHPPPALATSLSPLAQLPGDSELLGRAGDLDAAVR